MDPMTRLLLRLAQWYRNPPSRRWLWIAGITVVASLLLVGIERFVGWPDWATSQPVPMRPR
jgi:hypothetical protein